MHSQSPTKTTPFEPGLRIKKFCRCQVESYRQNFCCRPVFPCMLAKESERKTVRLSGSPSTTSMQAGSGQSASRFKCDVVLAGIKLLEWAISKVLSSCKGLMNFLLLLYWFFARPLAFQYISPSAGCPSFLLTIMSCLSESRMASIDPFWFQFFKPELLEKSTLPFC